MPSARYPHFQTDILRANDLVGLGQKFGAITYGLVDASDVYRAGIVQAVAALDYYFHGVILDKAVDILMGRQAAGAKTKIGIPFDAIHQILAAQSASDREQAARTHVAQRLSLETFQRADSIGTGLAMVGVAKVWASAFPNDPQQAMTNLNLVVARRNRIVHQGDTDPLTPGSPTPLTDADAADAVKLVSATVAAIDPFC